MPNRTHLPGLSALPEYNTCLSVWCPYSVDPEAELRLIVWGQLTCREGGNKSKKALLVGTVCCPHSNVLLNHPEMYSSIARFFAVFLYLLYLFFCSVM